MSSIENTGVLRLLKGESGVVLGRGLGWGFRDMRWYGGGDIV